MRACARPPVKPPAAAAMSATLTRILGRLHKWLRPEPEPVVDVQPTFAIEGPAAAATVDTPVPTGVVCVRVEGDQLYVIDTPELTVEQYQALEHMAETGEFDPVVDHIIEHGIAFPLTTVMGEDVLLTVNVLKE
jgi:hypothetical protein